MLHWAAALCLVHTCISPAHIIFDVFKSTICEHLFLQICVSMMVWVQLGVFDHLNNEWTNSSFWPIFLVQL